MSPLLCLNGDRLFSLSMSKADEKLVRARVRAVEALIAMLLSKPEVDGHLIKRLRARKTRLGRTVAV